MVRAAYKSGLVTPTPPPHPPTPAHSIPPPTPPAPTRRRNYVTRGTAAEPAVPEDPLRGEPTVAPDPDPDPDPGTGQGAVGPGGDVIRLIKGPQETV
jgi:hypothetical protein